MYPPLFTKAVYVLAGSEDKYTTREIVQCENFFKPSCELFGFLEIPNVGLKIFCLMTLGKISEQI
jgi:hypothetical protein